MKIALADRIFSSPLEHDTSLLFQYINQRRRLKETTRQLQEARQNCLRHLEELRRLRRQETAERELIANVSHEFRTPVAAIKGFAETLRRGGLQDRKNRLEFVKTIEKHSDWLAKLIENLLVLHSLNSKRRVLSRQSVDLAGFLSNFADSVAPLARKKQVALKISAAEGLRVDCDADHLERALQSLYENALKFTPSGGTVEISARACGQQALVAVRDEGSGIPPSLLPDFFKRLSRFKHRLGKGTGLGLRIAKCAVEANGGRIWVEKNPGRGVSFAFTVGLPSPKSRRK